MLPSELLRVKIIRNERIVPIFADLSDENLFLASSLIEAYNSCIGKKMKDLESLIREEERMAEGLGYDFKLIRGLKVLLNRKIIFEEPDTKIDPIRIRNLVFATCNEFFNGTCINEEERNKVFYLVAEKLKLDPETIQKAFYSIFDEEKKIKDFPKIGAEDLLKEYNLSLLQTLLFKCVKLYVDLQVSGHEMRRILWAMKRLGLLYIAEKRYSGINLAIDGPASVLRQIERYGTRMAKLLPYLVSQRAWSIRAYIRKKVAKNKYRVFKFETSKTNSANLFPEKKLEEVVYDSEIEEEFSKKFFSVGGEWNLIREPEPLVFDNFIYVPDFALVKGNDKIYLEIMGFWSEDYVKRKIEKLSKIKDIKLILAVDSSLGNVKIDNENIYVINFERKLSTVDVIKALNRLVST